MYRHRQGPRRRRLDEDDHGPPRGNWATSGADCLDITDMECPRDPEPVDATALQVGDEENYSDDSEPSAEKHEDGE